MKKAIFLLAGVLSSLCTYGQKSQLDTEKYASCELFAEKSGYDWQQRLSQMDSLEGQEVVVYEVKGKDNIIRSSYTGKVMNVWKKSGKAPAKGQATVVTVVEDLGGGKRSAHFPLTNDKNYRIYLRKCIE